LFSIFSSCFSTWFSCLTRKASKHGEREIQQGKEGHQGQERQEEEKG